MEGSATHWVRVSLQAGQSDLLYSQKRVIFLHSWPEKLYRAFKFGTSTYIASVLTRTDFVMARQFVSLWWPQTHGRGVSGELPVSRTFSELFPTCFEIWTWSLVYTSCRWHDTSSLSFNAIGCLSPTLQRSITQIRFSTHGLINYVNPPNLALTLI